MRSNRLRAFTVFASLIAATLAWWIGVSGVNVAGADNRNRYVPTPYARPVIDANAKGAIPNDGLSDTAAIQAALTEAGNAGGGTVYLKPGSYDLSWTGSTCTTTGGTAHKAALLAYSGTTVSCHGATFTLANRADCILLTNADWLNGNNTIEVDGGTWNGAYWKQFQNADNFAGGGTSPYWNGHGMVFVNVDRLRVHDARFEDHTKYALMLQGCTRWRTDNNDMATASDGTHISGPSFMGTVSGQTGHCRAVQWDLTASGGAGTFTRGELVTHANGATGYFLSEATGHVYLTRVSGTFAAGNTTITGAGGATRTVTGLAFQVTYDNNVPIVTDEDEIYYNNYAAPWVRLTVAGTTGLFELGEKITQAGSGATGTIRFESIEDGYVYLVPTTGTFNGSGTITGVNATRTVSAVSQAARPVNGILITDIQLSPTGTGQPFRITGHAQDIISDIAFENIKGKVVYGDCFTFGDDATGGAALVGSIQRRIRCRDIAVQVPISGNVFNISGSGVKSVDIDGLTLVNPKANGVYCNNGSAGGSLVMEELAVRNVKARNFDRAVVVVAASATVNKLDVHGVSGTLSNDAGSNAGIVVGVNGTVGTLSHSDWNLSATATGAVKGIALTGTITSVTGNNVTLTAPDPRFLEYSGSGTISNTGVWSNMVWTSSSTVGGQFVSILSGTPTQRLSFENVTLTGTSSTTLSYGFKTDSTNQQYINVTNLFSTGAWLYTFSVGGSAGLLTSNVSNWTLWDTTGLKAQNDSTVRMNVNGYHQSASGTGFDCGAGGGTATKVFLSLSNAVFAGSNNLLKAQAKCTVVCNLLGLEMPTGTAGTGFLTASAASGNPGDLRVIGAGQVTVTAGTLATRQTAAVNGILRVDHPNFKVDAAILTGTQGDRCWSTTTGGALLPATAGPAVCEVAGAPATADWDKSGRAF